MIIRRATPADAKALRGVVEAAYAPFVALDLPPVADGLDDDIATHNVWVADGGTVIGGIVVVQGVDAHIANLAVHPDAGGRGIGQALIAQACDAARAAGHDTIHLATHIKMTGTQAFYHKLGWEEGRQEGNKVYFSFQLQRKDTP
ncbi:MAG: GNAT family N-acetyltransferase [Pseudomonadota bacterium]